MHDPSIVAFLALTKEETENSIKFFHLCWFRIMSRLSLHSMRSFKRPETTYTAMLAPTSSSQLPSPAHLLVAGIVQDEVLCFSHPSMDCSNQDCLSSL